MAASAVVMGIVDTLQAALLPPPPITPLQAAPDSNKWIYLRAHKPGDNDGLFHTLQVDIINPKVLGNGESKVMQAAVIRMEDNDADVVMERIAELWPGHIVEEDDYINNHCLRTPFLDFRVSKKSVPQWWDEDVGRGGH